MEFIAVSIRGKVRQQKKLQKLHFGFVRFGMHKVSPYIELKNQFVDFFISIFYPCF